MYAAKYKTKNTSNSTSYISELNYGNVCGNKHFLLPDNLLFNSSNMDNVSVEIIE